MPFPNFHSARMTDPDQYDGHFAYKANAFGPGVDADYGIKDGKTELQAIRFAKSKFTAEEAKAWLEKNDKKFISFHEAKGDSVEYITVMRHDRHDIPSHTRKDKDGFLRTDAIVTRTGVFKYHNQDGSTRRELRHPDEVFRADSLDSLKMVPIINGHPKDRLVKSDIARELQVGLSGENVRPDGNNVRIPLVITDGDTVAMIESKRRNKLSCGYETDLVKQDGVFEGEPYDCIQTNIRYNHIALVDVARAGDIAQIKMDEGDAVLCNGCKECKCKKDINKDGSTITAKEAVMPKVNLDGIEYEAAPEVANALTKATATIKSLTTDLEKARGDGDAIKAELTTLKSRDVGKEVSEGVAARLSLEKMASVCLDGEDLVGKTDKEIKVAVIQKAFPEIKLDGKTSDYVNACFDRAVEISSKETNNDGMREQRRQSSDPSFRGDGDKNDADKSRDRMIRRMTRGDAGAKFCPECGAKMVNGECPDCGK